MMSEEPESSHTSISYSLGWLAFLIPLLIVLPLLNSTDLFWKDWGVLALQIAVGGFASMFFMEVLRGTGIRLKPKYRKIEGVHIARSIILFVLMMLIRTFSLYVPISIRSYEMALAVVFSAVSEEFIFRGVIVSFFVLIAKKSQNKDDKYVFEMKIYLPDQYQKESEIKKKLTLIELFGIIVSALAFMMFHENYYNNPQMLLTVFLWGLLLAFFFWYWDDITSCIIAHFAINIIWAMIFLGENWWMVYL